MELIEALTRRGLRIGTIKHTHHRHELDTPGKDSHRHRQAGAACVGILSPDLNAAFWTVPPHIDARQIVTPRLLDLQADCDLVLVEGDIETAADKIEVWRAGVSGEPIAADNASVLAVVSNDPRRGPLSDPPPTTAG